MTAETGQAVIAAVNAATKPEAGVPSHRSRADACVRLITGDDHVRARPEVIVHVHADTIAFDDGTAVAPEIAEQLACDGPVTTIADTEHGPVVIKKDPLIPFQMSATMSATGRGASRANVVRARRAR